MNYFFLIATLSFSVKMSVFSNSYIVYYIQFENVSDLFSSHRVKRSLRFLKGVGVKFHSLKEQKVVKFDEVSLKGIEVAVRSPLVRQSLCISERQLSAKTIKSISQCLDCVYNQ